MRKFCPYPLHSLSKLLKIFYFVFALFFSLRLSAQPTISSFSPVSGPIGTTVTITGSNFSAVPSNNIVYLGAVRANVTASTASSVTITVPAGATERPLSVTVNGLIGYSTRPFILTFPDGATISQGPDMIQNCFAPKIDSSTDLHPNSVVIMDFDGDGKPDIATPNNYSTTGQPASVSVMRNTGTAGSLSFEQRQDLLTGVLTNSLAAGDLDGDGKPDMVSSSVVDHTISVFRNTSVVNAISFAPKADISTGNSPVSVAIADIDKDGKPDIVVSTFSITSLNTISVFRNTSSAGNISFAPRVDHEISSLLGPISTGDLDGDGKVDVAVTNEFSNSVSVLRNTSTPGNISFAAKIDFTTGNAPKGIAIGDLDGDGKAEIVVANYNATFSFSVLRNTGSPGTISFASKVDFLCGANPTSVTIGDINGDAKPDIVIPSANLGVCQNNCTPGNISFGAIVYTFISPVANYAAIGDLTGDGKADLAASLFSSSAVSFLRNKNNEPTVRFFNPATAGTGSTVTITGYNFGNANAVKFGGVPATSFNVVNPTTIEAIVGTGVSGAVSVSNQYGEGKQDGFIFAGPPIITSFAPTAASANTYVTISGVNFSNVTEVSFGGFPTTNFTIESPTSIRAEVQLAASGNVTVKNPYGTASLPGFVVLPGFTSFSPAAAGTGVTVTINGSNLSTVTGVTFGGTPASSFSIVNNTTITAVVGNGSSGDITLTSAGGNVSMPGFTYIPPPVINSFSPTSAGFGTTVVISGTNFSGATAVSFGGVPANSFTVVNSTTINAVVAFGSASGNVSVTTPEGTASLPGFTFIPPPSIVSFSPVMTGTGGSVTITGSNLNGTTSVSFGDIAAQSFVVVNQNTITAIVAGGQSGLVKVVTPGGSTTAANNFTFTSLPVINSFSPSSGTSGTSVTISGANFNAVAANNHVYFGPVKATVTAASPNNLIVTVPAGATHDNITVSTGQVFCESSIPFLVLFTGGGAFTADMFTGRMDLAANGWVRGVITGDFNNDGLPDIVAANSGSNTISIYRNQSSPGILSFAPRIDMDATYSPYAFATADLDADGKLDLICLNETTGNYQGTVFRNTSTVSAISFGPRINFESNFFPTNVVVSDFTGDGKPDLAMTNTNTVLNGMTFMTLVVNGSTPGNIFFSNHYTIAVNVSVSDNERPVSIDKGDFDGDGRMDLVVGYANSFHRFVFTIMRNQGGVFSRIDVPLQESFQMNTRQLTVADFDNDGRPDIVGNGEIFRNVGNFNFEHTATGQMGMITDVADLNGDGKVDYVRADAGGSSVTVFGNQTAGTTISLPQGFSYATGNDPRGLYITDLDADGKPEIITANFQDNRVSILKNGLNSAGPLITSFTPVSGIAGTSVTITGSGFVNVNGVSFGGVPAASITVNSSTSITAIVANGNSGNVEVQTAAGNAVKAWFAFIPPPPAITSFTPASAPGGALITITGTNFIEVSAVKFGGVPAQSFNVVSSTTITAITGSGASGDVEVTNPGGTGSKSGFVFLPAPTITAFTPATAGAGATIGITGTGFDGATLVSFGGQVASSFVVNSSTSITAVVSTGGSGPVRVETPGGIASKDGFVFVPPPFITNFFPASAPQGATVNIAGERLTGATAVSFGAVPATSFTVVNSNNITAVVGNGASGDVSVTTIGGTASRAGFIFAFPTAINDPVSNSKDLVAYPNPADDVLLIRHPASIRNPAIRLLDITGREIKLITPSRNSRQTQTDIKELAAGIYQLVWSDGTRRLLRTILVK